MDGRGDHLFVEQRQRFAVPASTVSSRAAQSAVIDAVLCGGMISVLKTPRGKNVLLILAYWSSYLWGEDACANVVSSGQESYVSSRVFIL